MQKATKVIPEIITKQHLRRECKRRKLHIEIKKDGITIKSDNSSVASFVYANDYEGLEDAYRDVISDFGAGA